MVATNRLRQRAARAVTAVASLAASIVVTASPAHAQAQGRRIEGTVHPAPHAPLRGFDAYVAKGMREWRVPGIAVGVVHGDSIVLLEGYGVRTIGRPERVDPRTVFPIASDTKAFTGILMAMLADRERIDWDDPVTEHLPGFQLYDSSATRELTIRDLLTHSTGLARADLLWTAGYGYSTAEALRRVRYLKPTWSPGTHFGYNNVMYGAAGQVISHASGESWSQMLRARIFRPLGMTCSNTSVKSLASLKDVATPHALVDGAVHTEPYLDVDMIPAAAAINSCAADMVKWLRFQLDSGRVHGRRLVSARNFRETHIPRLAMPMDPVYRALNPATNLRSYAIGWTVQDYHGHEMLSHPGDISGMASTVGILPEKRLGVVILSNLEDQELRESLMYWIFDRYLGAPRKDWSAVTLAVHRRADSADAANERVLQATRVRGTHPSHPLARYAGTYVDSLYGTSKVRLENGHLVFEITPTMIGDLEHWQYDIFRVTWRDHRNGKEFVRFDLDPTTARVTTLQEMPEIGEPTEEVPVWSRTEAPGTGRGGR